MSGYCAIPQLSAPVRGLFRVKRSSARLGGHTPPCEGAVQRMTVIVDWRYTDDPKKLRCNKGTDGDWWIRGTNHRIENGCICRDLGWQAGWFIEIPDVMDFVRQYGDCVVSIDEDGYESIEIYDDYRE